MKIDPRKKWTKADSVSLDRSSTDTAIEIKWISSTRAWSIENYDFRIFRSEIRPILYYFIRVSFLPTIVIYKAYFKSRHIWIQRLKTRILCVKLLRLCTIGFVTKCFLIFIIYEVKNFAANQSFKLLELVMYWDLCKGVNYRLKICALKERRLLQYQVHLGIEAKVQL